MANNDGNADSGSPSLSEEENNVSDKTPSDRPKLVVDLNIPLQQDRSEPAGGIVNYGFEYNNENQINDCSSNLNDSKSLAKDKYANESTNDHRYGAKLLGKVLNTSCDTEITIPDDPNMNCNKSRMGNTNSQKSKESQAPEKIPLEEVHSTVVPIISDNYDKALEAQKEYSATQNGGKDISHEVSGVNTDKLNQQRSNGKRFEEYFMPANTHKKLLRGEKLYLTKEKEVATCSGWKLVVVCGIVLLVVVGVLLGVLAGVGLLMKESSVITKGSSLPDSASMSAEAKHSNELPLSSLPITVSPNHPSFQTVPKVLIVELTLRNETFSDELLNDNSKEYIALVLQARKMLTSSFKNLGMNFSAVEVLHSSSDSIIARFIINFKGSEISESSATEMLQKYIQQKNNMISNYHVKDIFVRIVESANTCLVNNGNCSHTCHWDERHYSQTCLCPSNSTLSDDLKTCLKKHLGDGKINDVNAEKTTLTPKMTEVPTTHSSLLLVTEIVTTTPKRESSIWTSVSDSAGSYDASTMQSFESSAESHNDFSTESSVTNYSEDPHEINTYETTVSESKILELTTIGRTTDNASDLYTLTSKTEAKYGYNDNDIIVTTSRRDLSMIANLTDSAEEVTNSSISNNNISNTLEMVTDNDFSPSITYPGTGTNFSNVTSDGRTFITMDNVTEFNEFSTSIYKITANNTTTAANEVDTITNGNSILYSTLSTVMSSNSFDHSTIGINSVTETTTTRMDEVTTLNETTAETVLGDSPENYTKWDNVSNVTDTEYTNVSFVTDTYNQTIATSLVLNATNSANLNIDNNASPLNPLNNESTVTEHEVLFAQNVTKEQTLVEISTNMKNSSETVMHAIENTEENTTPQILSTVNYDINEDVTLEHSVSTIATTSYTIVATNEVTQFTTANASEAYTDKTNSSEFLDTEMNTSENISTITFNTNFAIDVLNATVHSEEIIPKRTTEVKNTSYFETTSTNQFLTTSTNHLVTSTEKGRVYQVSDETTSANDYTSTNDLISDIPDTSDDSYISSLTKNSTNFVSSSSITDNITLNDAFTTENIQSSAQAKGIDYITENANVTETELSINNNNGHSIQDSNLWTSSVVASTIEVTDCDNCTTEVVSITEQTTTLLSLNPNESKPSLNADIITSTSTMYNSSDSIMFTTDASSQLVDSNSSQFVEFTTVTELTDISTSDLEIGDDSTVGNNSLVDSVQNNASVELGYTLSPENISADSYNNSTEMQLNLNFSDFSIGQLNENMSILNSKNVRKLIDTNFYDPNENRSLKDDGFSSNRSEFEISAMDNSGSDIENENQMDFMNTTTFKSEEIVMNETMYSNCSEAEESCGLNFLCTNSSMVVSFFARCDDIWDCEDGSDEVGCEPTSCGIKEVMCSDGSACIKPADICNEVYNCHDKSDEVGCVERTTCDTNRFFCPEGLCIPLAQLCDAVQDCRNGEDEANCSCTGSDVFQCSNSICLSKDVFCDGKIDCQDGSDERGCIKVDVFGVIQIYDHNNQTWKLLCGENWSENDGNYLCQELGFSSAREVGTVLVSTEADWMERNNYLSNDSTLWTLGVQPIDFCARNMTATVKCEEYACGGTQSQYRRKRIAGGQESGHLPGQWTSLAVLYNTKSNETCHGEVISPVWILTSSQCLFSHLMNFNDISVRAGIISVNELENSTQERKAKEIVIHPHSSIHRSPTLRDYDVALIRVDEPFELNRHVNAICLGEEEIQEGITCFTGSFQNRKSNEESHTTSSLSHLAVSVIDRNSCNSTEHYSKSITNRMICGQTTGSTSLCNNDDGVPLMCLSTQRKYHVAGMLSYQHNCGMYYKQPAVFSNINDMRPFIEMIVGKNRYNISYGSLYVIPEMVDDNTTDKNNITTDSSAIESTVQTELWESTDNTFNSDGITEAQINNTTYETTSTSLFVEDLLNVTTATVMTDTYLLNETNSNQSSDILENVSNATLLPKLVLNNGEMQHYVLTPAEVNEPENITTAVTLEEFELFTEVHSTIPSILVINDTEDDITKERRKALDYAPANRTIINLVNNTEEIEQYMEVVSISLTPDNATDNNMNISNIFQTESSSMENTLTIESTVDSLITTQISSDSLIVEPTAEIPNSNITEANVIAVTTEIPDLEQHVISDLIQTSVHSEYAPLNVDNDKQFLKDEYIPNSTNNVVIPVVTENSKDITALTPSTEDTEENIQNADESTTILLKNSEQDVFEDSMVVNNPKHLIDYSSNNFASKLEDFDIPVSSDNYTQKDFILPSQVLTYSSTVSDLLPKANSATTEIVEVESDFSSVQEMLNSTVAAVFTDEELLTTMPQEIEISNDGFDNSTVIPDVQEHKSPELNETVTFESTTFKYYATHMGSECGVQGFEDANSTWPYIGILKENVSCLASIISPKWLITSYHCLLNGASPNITTWTFQRGYFRSTPKNIVIHPQFETLGIDMALVELEEINLERNSSICLPKYNTTSQHQCKTVVWTENMEGESVINYVPASAEPVMNCDISYNKLPVQHICINDISQTCQENGIPLMCVNENGQWQLQGISSPKTCENNSTFIYFDVRFLVPWIENTIILEVN